jgi:hypothetical protein
MAAIPPPATGRPGDATAPPFARGEDTDSGPDHAPQSLGHGASRLHRSGVVPGRGLVDASADGRRSRYGRGDASPASPSFVNARLGARMGELATGLVAALVGGIAGIATSTVSNLLERRGKIDDDVRTARLQVYEALWRKFGFLPKWPQGSVTPAQLPQLSGSLRDWYFGTAPDTALAAPPGDDQTRPGGMYLSKRHGRSTTPSRRPSRIWRRRPAIGRGTTRYRGRTTTSSRSGSPRSERRSPRTCCPDAAGSSPVSGPRAGGSRRRCAIVRP